MSIPIEADVPVDRLPQTIEATAYFIVAEALTNVAKHAQASRASVTARLETEFLTSRCVTMELAVLILMALG